MTGEGILIAIIVALAAAWLVCRAWRQHRARRNGGSACGGCSLGELCERKQDDQSRDC